VRQDELGPQTPHAPQGPLGGCAQPTSPLMALCVFLQAEAEAQRAAQVAAEKAALLAAKKAKAAKKK